MWHFSSQASERILKSRLACLETLESLTIDRYQILGCIFNEVLIAQFLREVTKAVRPQVKKLTVLHFNQVSIPSLSTKNSETGEMEGPKLRGLYAHYAILAPKGVPEMAYLRKQVELGLKKERAARRRLAEGA